MKHQVLLLRHCMFSGDAPIEVTMNVSLRKGRTSADVDLFGNSIDSSPA
jgi:hypothetical protein